MSFIDFSKNLPLPANPYLQGVQLFGQFAQKIIDADIQSSEDKLPAAALSFDLASSDADVAQCETQRNVAWRYPILRDGIVAVMWDYQGKPEDGFVRVSDVDRYCYYPTLSQRIAFAAKSNDTCPPAAQAKPLNNPLVAFAINKWSVEPRSNRIEHFNIGPLSGAISEPILTYSGAQAATKKTEEKYPLSAAGVKTYFDAINTNRLYEQFKQAPSDARQQEIAIREVETAIALHRCGLLGISAKDCL